MRFGRQERAAVLFLVVGSAVPLHAVENRPPTVERKPNIVLILADNLGYGELGAYGGGLLRGAPTPRIDRLAGEGLRLLNFNARPSALPRAPP